MTFVTRSSEASTPPSVLAVNGNPDICEGFTQLLTLKGYEVESISYGETCFERIQHHAFSAVILHDRLPDQDGPTSAYSHPIHPTETPYHCHDNRRGIPYRAPTRRLCSAGLTLSV